MSAEATGGAGLGLGPAPDGSEAPGGDAGRAVGEEALQDALARAYRFLASRDRTVAEIRRHLARQGIAEQLIDATVAELSEFGYLDDARFATRFTEDRRTLDGWGSERIRTRLITLGIAPELAAEAAGRRDGEEELAAAVEVLRRRLRVPPADERARHRGLGLLLRRGYDLELAHDAIRRFAADA